MNLVCFHLSKDVRNMAGHVQCRVPILNKLTEIFWDLLFVKVSFFLIVYEEIEREQALN